MKVKQKFWWGSVLAWLFVIYYLSNQPNLQSALAPDLDFIARKIAHMSEYFVLVFLLYHAYQASHTTTGEALVLAVVGVICVASLDEWHQSFVAGRHASVIDVAIDTVGALGFTVLKKRENV